MTQPASFTDADVARLREELGTNVDLDDAFSRYQRIQATGAPNPLSAVILEVLKQRRADFLAAPAQFTIQGDYQQSTQANIAGLDSQIAAVAGDMDDNGVPDQMVTVSRLHSRWARPSGWCGR